MILNIFEIIYCMYLKPIFQLLTTYVFKKYLYLKIKQIMFKGNLSHKKITLGHREVIPLDIP